MCLCLWPVTGKVDVTNAVFFYIWIANKHIIIDIEGQLIGWAAWHWRLVMRDECHCHVHLQLTRAFLAQNCREDKNMLIACP